MDSITLRLPQRASVRDDVAFIVHVLGNVFPDERQLAGRTLRSRLSGNLLELVELVLQSSDPRLTS